MSDISHLFPQLAQSLENWDGGSGVANDGHDDPSHAGVTDEAVEEYLRSMGSLRAPLSPPVSGAAVPPTPEFANNGRAVPPGGNATVEPPQAPSDDAGTGDGVPEGPGEPLRGEEVPPTSTQPGETVTPPPPPPEPDFYDIAGRKVDKAQAEAWMQFDAMVAQDPQLRETIATYLRSRQVPQQGGAGVSPPAPPAAPTVPDLPPEYADDPFYQQLHATLKQQQEVLDRVSRQSQFAAETVTQQTQRTYSDIAQGAITEFQKEKGLDEQTMAVVSRAAAASGFAEKYMSGFDPLTGTPVKPDPYRATRAALEAGYYMTPETRQVEVERQVKASTDRAAADRTRKEKLGGVSGAAGSVPRTQAVPNDPTDRRSALVGEVAAMMNGNWPGDGSQ